MLCRFSDLPVNYKLKNFVKTAALKPIRISHFFTLLPIKCFVLNIVFFLVSGVNCEIHRWILKRIFNY